MSTRTLWINVIAVAALVYISANVGHEIAGHGAMCVVVGAKLKAVEAVYVDCDASMVSWGRQIVIKAAGTGFNIAAFLLAMLAHRAMAKRSKEPGLSQFALWLALTVNGLQAAGYWLFSGILGVGDWAAIATLTPYAKALRVLLTVLGAVSYWAVVRYSLRAIQPLVGASSDRASLTKILCLGPYFTGGLLYVVAGSLNPISFSLVLISAAAASFGGTSALTWMHDLPDKWGWDKSATSLVSAKVSLPWVLSALLVAAVYVLVLGPSIILQH